jgi:malonate transporter and related proteins
VNDTVFLKLFAIMAVVAVGFAAGRMRWLGPATGDDNDPSRVLSNAAFYIFVPA